MKKSYAAGGASALFVGAVVALVVEAWLAMLIIGAIHSEVPDVPPFGFTAAGWLVLLVHLLVGAASRQSTS